MADDAYYTAGVNAGLSPDLAAYMPRYVQIESGGNPQRPHRLLLGPIADGR